MAESISIKSAIITGATGSIGIKLLDLLAESGIRMLLISHPGSPMNRHLSTVPNASVSLCGLEGLNEMPVSTNWDAFFHLGWIGSESIAARSEIAKQRISIACTLDAVELAGRAGCKVFVGAGSQAEYGRLPDGVARADSPVEPIEAYGVAKYAAGRLAGMRCRQLGMRFCWARILSIFGEYCRPVTLIMYAIDSLLQGKSPAFTRCEQIWDYLYTGDCAEALFNIARSGSDGAVYPLGGGKPRPLLEYLEEIRYLVNPEIEMRYGALPYPPGQIMRMTADMEPLLRDTGYSPYTSFSDAIRAILKWRTSDASSPLL